jgi:hypothetical protein
MTQATNRVLISEMIEYCMTMKNICDDIIQGQRGYTELIDQLNLENINRLLWRGIVIKMQEQASEEDEIPIILSEHVSEEKVKEYAETLSGLLELVVEHERSSNE